MGMQPEAPSQRSIRLWDESEYDPVPDGFRPWLDPYPLPGQPARGAVLIFPGGGYSMRAPHEGLAIAEQFNAAGMPAFVAHYSVAPRRHPQPLRDASRAIRIVRRRAAEWSINPARIAVMGFSAGGHLAGSLGTLYARPDVTGAAPIDALSNRPDALILCYPVISAGPLGHQGSFANLLGPEASQEQRLAFSLENQVTSRTPPAFLWHTVEDAGVPVENSLLFAAALRRAGVPFEMHVYPRGRHGLGLASDDPHLATWFELCVGWLLTMGW